MRVGKPCALIAFVASLLLAGCQEEVPLSENPASSGSDLPNTPAVPNTPPIITGTPATSVVVGTRYQFQPIATDADADPLTFSVTGLPVWAAFDPQRGLISGTPAAGYAGVTADITVSVSDGRDLVRLPAFQIAILPAPVTPQPPPPANQTPSISGTPATQLQATTAYSFVPTASDPDGATLTFSVLNKPSWASFSTATGALVGTPGVGQSGVYSNIVISVSDGALTASLPAFSIQVTPASNAPPILTGTPATAITVGSSYLFAPTAFDPEGQTVTFTASNLPGWASLSTSTGVISGVPGSSHVGNYSGIVLRASDGSNTVSLSAFSITVSAAPNNAPVISGTPPGAIVAGNAYSFTPSASDADGQSLSFSITNKPDWAAFNTATGALTGTPGGAQAGSNPGIVISVSDGQASASLPAFAITVSSPLNQAPAISGLSGTSVTAGAAYSFAPSASDADGDTLTFSISNKPGWASFSTTTGALTGTPTGAQVGSYPGIVITVNDGQATASLSAFTITVNSPPNTAPTIAGAPSVGVTAASPYVFQPSAFDADGQSLTWSVTNLPPWATFNSSTGALTGTPTGAQIGTYSNVTISVSDGTASASLPAFAITVSAVPNSAPTISGSPATAAIAGSAYGFTPSASDTDGDTLTFNISNKPVWASFNTTTGALTGTAVSAHVGMYPNIVISVSDGTSSASLPTFTITVNAPPNATPTISGSPATTVTAGNAYNFAPAASDTDADTLSFTIANRPSWASFNTATGALTGTPNSAQVGSYPNIVITVTDGQANASLTAFTIAVAAPPNQAPTISGTPATSVTAGNAYSFTPSAADANGDTLTFTIANKPGWASFNTTSGALTGTPNGAQVGTYAGIVIIVSDGQVNVPLPAFPIIVNPPPNSAPTISGTPTALVTAGNAYSFIPSSHDSDGDTLSFTIVNKPAWASFSTTTGALTGTPNGAQTGSYSNIVITVSDGQASAMLPAFAVTVNAAPNNAPVISGAPALSITIGLLYSFTPTASDADGQALTFSISNQPAWSIFNPNTGALTGIPLLAQSGAYSNIVISVSDGTATTALAAFTINVNTPPNNAPTISGTPATSVTAGNGYSFTPSANDADGETLGFAITNKPSWATFNTATGALTGTPGAPDAGIYSNIQISVSDGHATTYLASFAITVIQLNGSATLSWAAPNQNDDNSSLTDLAGFYIYQGPSAGSLSRVATIADPLATSAVRSGLASGTYYFAVSAYTNSGVEGVLSPAASKTIP
jgi:trimeric autotransporter adhesin